MVYGHPLVTEIVKGIKIKLSLVFVFAKITKEIQAK